jgi:hypothetical protein
MGGREPRRAASIKSAGPWNGPSAEMPNSTIHAVRCADGKGAENENLRNRHRGESRPGNSRPLPGGLQHPKESMIEFYSSL